MPRKPTKQPVVDEPVVPTDILAKAVPKPETDGLANGDEKPTPAMTDDGWTIYVLGLLRDDETFDGAPNVDGLRRVTEVVLGEVIESVSEVAGVPSAANGGTATVVHTITIFTDGNLKKFSGVADVNKENTDPEFARFASATAETRAEARAYRRALRLKKVCAAEEMTTVPVATISDDAKASDHQLVAIKFLCSKLNINAAKYLNSGESKYDTPREIPHKVAQKMLAHLNVLQQDKSKIKQEHVGYDGSWNAY
jgi:hypothetical protein